MIEGSGSRRPQNIRIRRIRNTDGNKTLFVWYGIYNQQGVEVPISYSISCCNSPLVDYLPAVQEVGDSDMSVPGCFIEG
jgi:hypothetical protein